MKTKFLLQTTGLIILLMLLTTFYSNAQIQIQGLHVDHEGSASWDADGSGPEPEGNGHPHPFGWANTPYYGASCDYDDIDPHPDAALAHFLDDINGFPLFEQALTDNGFTPGQVKLKTGLLSLKSDIEGEDWFTLNSNHYFNYHDAYFIIEINGEPMISGYLNYAFFSYDEMGYNHWRVETNYTKPFDVSSGSSIPVQDVALAFLEDMEDYELRLKYEHIQSTGVFFDSNGRDGVFFEIVSGSLEKGLPELPFSGLAADHHGLACWDADGTGPEPEAFGHTYSWNGVDYSQPYYVASCDYDGIDPDKNAAAGHIIEDLKGFPNLNIQLNYRGYTLDQLKIKIGIGTLGNDIEEVDWGYDGSIHWYTSYGYDITLELVGEPILEYGVDTSHSYVDLAIMDYWYSSSSFSKVTDISNTASSNAQYVAMSFMKDLGGHLIGSDMKGYYAGDMEEINGRIEGVYQQFVNSKLIARQPAGTHIWEKEVSGIWDLARSPFIVMGELEIPDGEKLTINPGVVVQFNTTEMFIVNGCLEAEGNEENPILFTALDESVRWGGIGWDQTPINNETSKIKHCIFEYAYAYNPEGILGYNSGGALSVNNYENIEISHCLFRYNLAAEPGFNGPTGGALILNESSLHISHCIFHDNKAGHGGAMTIASNSNPIIDNCLFYNNEAMDWYGGAILTYIDCSPFFINCTFADNYALYRGGVAELQHGGTATFTNCIMWGNKADDGPSQISIWDPEISFLNIYYSDIDEGENGIEPGFQGEYLYNIDEDPFFTTYEGYQYVPDTLLAETINVGSLNSDYFPEDWICPDECLCGNPRVDGGIIDMGCYEYDEWGVGISEPSIIDNLIFSIFPNPINSNPSIQIYLDNETIVHISILDIHGRIISEMEIQEFKKGTNQLTLNTEKMKAGLYFCQLKIGNKVATTKLVKLN